MPDQEEGRLSNVVDLKTREKRICGDDQNAEIERIYQELTKGIEFTPENVSRLINYNCTDAGNAELFRDLAGDKFRFVPELGHWLKYDGVRWANVDEEAKLMMLAIVRRRCDAANYALNSAGNGNNDLRQKIIRWSLSSESNFKLSAALEVAQCMLYKHFSDFDKDPFLLCCSNGVIDLRLNGEGFQKARPEDYLHKHTPIKYDPYAECLRWLQFQNEVCLNDQAMIEFKQKAYGYTLTGRTTEQCLFLCWGGGQNGKSTELGVLESLLGEYALSTPASTFKEQYGNDSIPNDIARMAGMRLVKTIEIKEGVRLNEERIKALTGGDRISARFLHREFFDYWPEYKLWLATNHKPIIKGTDEAIWRRIRLIPFEAHFPPEKKDPNLLDTLKSELPGILLWALEGCYMWQREGLTPADRIREATKEYREESDLVGRFLSECTVRKEGAKVKAGELYEAFAAWCGGKAEISQTSFGLKMKEKGFIKKPLLGYPHYQGIGLIDG